MKDYVVVDTNVLLVAEGQSSYTLRCKASCGNALQEIRRNQIVVLDSGREILTEYGKKLEGIRGQRGLGHEFWKWLLNTRVSHASCETVNLTLHAVKGYKEFPDHDGLKEFDWSDRKFVAVAAAHLKRPKIVQAGDSKWLDWKDSLSECGIELNLPCEAELKAKWKTKTGKDA